MLVKAILIQRENQQVTNCSQLFVVLEFRNNFHALIQCPLY
ncbi:hypothetical protein T12_13400 [Trichinella patagoniensis]|uniref:Uncharacterized protein n=1 Tax=Trichinella patagoniensis TaxID=990121 RepID=A0A0V0YT41_9BILA|nr:hypothetical protein T12_13400 [Trichinella patagoniensis]